LMNYLGEASRVALRPPEKSSPAIPPGGPWGAAVDRVEVILG